VPSGMDVCRLTRFDLHRIEVNSLNHAFLDLIRHHEISGYLKAHEGHQSSKQNINPPAMLSLGLIWQSALGNRRSLRCHALIFPR
jgi:hypothetical protein